MQIHPATEVRKYFQETIDHVHYSGEPMVVSKHGKPWVIIHPLPEDDISLQKMKDKASKARSKMPGKK